MFMPMASSPGVLFAWEMHRSCQSVICITSSARPASRDCRRASASATCRQKVPFQSPHVHVSATNIDPRSGGKDGQAPKFHGFWRPAIRSSWIPPVPETAGRQISTTKPPHCGGFVLSAEAILPCDHPWSRKSTGGHLWPYRAKNDGAPRGAVLLPFTARDQAPVLPIPACVPAPPLPMKVRKGSSRLHAKPRQNARSTIATPVFSLYGTMLHPTHYDVI